jgi:hypothetical protein
MAGINKKEQNFGHLYRHDAEFKIYYNPCDYCLGGSVVAYSFLHASFLAIRNLALEAQNPLQTSPAFHQSTVLKQY